MAEHGFEEAYDHHVPQQSRRDKLREVNNHHLIPLYDPSLDNFISTHNNFINPGGVKEEGLNFMGFANNNNHMFVDPNPSATINNIQDHINAYRGLNNILDHHQSFHHQGNEVYKPQPMSAGGQSLSLELNLERYDHESSMFNGGGSGNNNNNSHTIEFGKSSVPLGPFTGYASVLKGSRFLKPAQQLLEELCDVGRGFCADKDGPDPSLLDPPPFDDCSTDVSTEQTRKKSRLLLMLDEVYKRYKQYYQQMQAAVASFESVAGLSSAAPFANLAVKAMSKHFICLKNAITDQLQFTTTNTSHGKIQRDESQSTQRLENSGGSRGPNYNQRPFHSTPGFVDQPVWRPQRGLPERAVTVLRAWLFEHFLHPYPTDTDKLTLAKQTGLSRNQVSNWFINARVRLWKPMVEEIHMLETRQGQKGPQKDQDQQQQPPPNNRLINNHLPTSCSIECENNASTSIQRIGGDVFPLKRTRDDLIRTEVGSMKLPYDHQNLLHSNNNNNNPHLGMGVSNINNGGGGVSLTLGLHQNGVGLPESSYPIHAARRLGLDSHGEGYVVSRFGGQNRQFGRDVVDGGQFLHEFVG